jgi:hypothetical protein
VHVSTQDVRQDQGVAGVGLLARDRVAVAVAGGGHRVDRVDLAVAGPQDRHEQAAGGLDRHGDRVLLRVTVLGKQVQQDLVAGRVVGDVPLGHQLAGVVDQGDVVRPLCPVDAAVDQVLPSPGHGSVLVRATRRPNPRTRQQGRSATSVAVRGTSSPHGPRSMREFIRLAYSKRSPCGGLAPRRSTSKRSSGGSREDAERCRSVRRLRNRISERHPSGVHATATTTKNQNRPPIYGKATRARMGEGMTALLFERSGFVLTGPDRPHTGIRCPRVVQASSPRGQTSLPPKRGCKSGNACRMRRYRPLTGCCQWGR